MEVQGVKLLIDGSFGDVDIATVGLRAALNLVDDATQKIHVVRQDNVDPIGLPHLNAARKSIEDAIKSLATFKNDVGTYRAML